MKLIWTGLKTSFVKISNGLIFYPSMVIAVILIVGLFVLSFEELDSVVKELPFLVIHDLDTIRATLTAFLTGLISITVFSFSMVMLVFSQASSNYSYEVQCKMFEDLVETR